MSDSPEELEDLLDDPASYPDDSVEDVDGELPLLNDLLPVEQDFEGIEFIEGIEDPEDYDPELGQDPSGLPSAPIPGPLELVSAWSEVDEDGEYEELVEEAEEPIDEPEEDLSDPPEIDEEDENEPEDLGPAWSKYEVWGRDRDEPVEWQLLSTQDYGLDAQAEIDNLRTGTRMEFRVRLISTENVTSEWSELFYYNLPSDLTPPPAPTPPTAVDNSGLITHEHDGTLVDSVPADMSHRVLYAQQMEPTMGDPMRIAEWRGVGAGTITTARYQDRVLHRCWLIAVDTTGNESARSEYVEFTPSQPVDAQRINDELTSISDRVGPGFDQSLTDAMVDVDNRVDRLVVGELFVPGAIKAVSIDVQDLAVDEARMNQLWAGFAGISEAQIDDLLGNSAKFKYINGAEITGGTIATAEGVNGRVKFRRYTNTEVYGGSTTARMLAGMGFESDSISRVAGAFVQEDDGRVVLSSGTGGDSTNGRPYGYLAGGWEAQWLRPRDRLETFDNCIVGRPTQLTLLNGFRDGGSGTQSPTYTRLGDWVVLSGSIRQNLSMGNWGGSIGFLPAPAFERRIPTNISSASGVGGPEGMNLIIDIGGRLSVLDGYNVNRNWTLSLDGLTYKL